MTDVQILNDTGSALHRPVLLTIDGGVATQMQTNFQIHRAFPVDAESTGNWEAEEREVLTERAISKFSESFDTALEEEDVDEAYAVLCDCFESYFSMLCNLSEREAIPFCGRGRLRTPRQRRLCAPNARLQDEQRGQGGAATLLVRRWAAQKERLRDLARVVRTRGWGQEASLLWSSIQRAGKLLQKEGDPAPLPPAAFGHPQAPRPALALLEDWGRTATRVFEQTRTNAAKVPVARWNSKMEDSAKGTRSVLYKWLMAEETASSIFATRADGSITANGQDFDEIMKDGFIFFANTLMYLSLT